MKNFVQDGHTITVTLTSPVAGGDGVLLDNMFGVACYSAEANTSSEVKTNGVFDLEKDTNSGSALTAFGAAYWLAAEKKVTGSGEGNVLIGFSVGAFADDAATARVRLNGTSVVSYSAPEASE